MFDKKPEVPKEETPKTEPRTETPQPVTPPVAGGVPEVDPREAKAVKMLITFHPDSQEIQVQNVQNLTRPIAMYVTNRVFKTYENEELAMTVVKNLATLVENSKHSKERLWVPGSKK